MSRGRLAGKTAIVTGGGSGIGRAICILFAEEGASVAVLDINSDGIKETMSLMSSQTDTNHCAIEADVSSADQVKRAFKEVEDKLGSKTNVLVNNAGITRECHIHDTSEMDFDDVINTNLKGPFLMCREFVTSLGKLSDLDTKERGAIVNISSLAGKMAYYFTAYSAAKAGVLGLTKSITIGYQKHRVRCNAILPGGVQTPLLASVDKWVVDECLEAVPMKRIGKPEEIAKPCLFLASDESSYMNGACLDVSGGWGV